MPAAGAGQLPFDTRESGEREGATPSAGHVPKPLASTVALFPEVRIGRDVS